MATTNLGFDNFLNTTLSSDINDTDVDIPLDSVPSASEGFLVIEPNSAANREIIYYTSKTASKVVVPSGAGNGRGYDGTTASSHSSGVQVIAAPVAAMFEALQDASGINDGVITNEKMSSANIEQIRIVQASGNDDANDTSYADWGEQGTATVPSWANSCIVWATVHSAVSVTAANEWDFKVLIGTDESNEHHVDTQTLNQDTPIAFSDTITLTSTGSQTIKFQAKRAAGSGAVRARDDKTTFSFVVMYLP